MCMIAQFDLVYGLKEELSLFIERDNSQGTADIACTEEIQFTRVQRDMTRVISWLERYLFARC